MSCFGGKFHTSFDDYQKTCMPEIQDFFKMYKFKANRKNGTILFLLNTTRFHTMSCQNYPQYSVYNSD